LFCFCFHVVNSTGYPEVFQRMLNIPRWCKTAINCQRCGLILMKLVTNILSSQKELQSFAWSGQNRNHTPRLVTFTHVMKAVFVASFRRSLSYNRQQKIFLMRNITVIQINCQQQIWSHHHHHHLFLIHILLWASRFWFITTFSPTFWRICSKIAIYSGTSLLPAQCHFCHPAKVSVTPFAVRCIARRHVVTQCNATHCNASGVNEP